MRSRTSEERYSRSLSARIDVPPQHLFRAVLAGPEVGLAREVQQFAHVAGESPLILDAARGVLDHSRRRLVAEASHARHVALACG